MSSGTPAASSSSGVSWLCVVVALWMASDLASPMLARWLNSPSASTNRLPPSRPDFTPKLAPRGTAFQQAVWQKLGTIPYGKTSTYGELARALNCASARAVGGAVGRNPISLLIPCHRVLGTGGRLTGYAGGLSRKQWLLALEGGES